MAWARKQFELAAPSARGKSNLAAHIRQLAKSGRAPEWAKELSAQTVTEPPGLLPQWGIYCALSRRRRSGMNGPEPLTDLDLLAWERGYSVSLAVWERELLFDLDSAFLEVWHDRSRQSRDPNPGQGRRRGAPRSR